MPTAAEIYYTQYDGGQKEQLPVILLHGTGSSHLGWPAEVRRLAGQRVIALDLPGHGRSGGVGLQSIGAYADKVVEFLSDLGLYYAVLVGHSMGGAIALDIALRYPSYAAGLGLISTGAFLGIDQNLLDAFANAYTLKAALHTFQQRAFAPQTSPAVIENYLQLMRATRASVLASDWRACAKFDQRSEVSQISAPAWVIAGLEDRLTPVAYAHFLAGSLPASRLDLIANAGHLVPQEQPERVVQSLQQFLMALFATLRSSPGGFYLPNSQPAPSATIRPSEHSTPDWNKLFRKS